tara:strand:+ start:321 stop:542 length:222 start_codon:yes stop_codon:yes gene_type:complete
MLSIKTLMQCDLKCRGLNNKTIGKEKEEEEEEDEKEKEELRFGLLRRVFGCRDWCGTCWSEIRISFKGSCAFP